MSSSHAAIDQGASDFFFERSLAEYATQFEWSTEQQMPAVAPVIFTLPVSIVFRQLIATATWRARLC